MKLLLCFVVLAKFLQDIKVLPEIQYILYHTLLSIVNLVLACESTLNANVRMQASKLNTLY